MLFISLLLSALGLFSTCPLMNQINRLVPAPSLCLVQGLVSGFNQIIQDPPAAGQGQVLSDAPFVFQLGQLLGPWQVQHEHLERNGAAGCFICLQKYGAGGPHMEALQMVAHITVPREPLIGIHILSEWGQQPSTPASSIPPGSYTDYYQKSTELTNDPQVFDMP